MDNFTDCWSNYNVPKIRTVQNLAGSDNAHRVTDYNSHVFNYSDHSRLFNICSFSYPGNIEAQLLIIYGYDGRISSLIIEEYNNNFKFSEIGHNPILKTTFTKEHGLFLKKRECFFYNREGRLYMTAKIDENANLSRNDRKKLNFLKSIRYDEQFDSDLLFIGRMPENERYRHIKEKFYFNLIENSNRKHKDVYQCNVVCEITNSKIGTIERYEDIFGKNKNLLSQKHSIILSNNDKAFIKEQMTCIYRYDYQQRVSEIITIYSEPPIYTIINDDFIDYNEHGDWTEYNRSLIMDNLIMGDNKINENVRLNKGYYEKIKRQLAYNKQDIKLLYSKCDEIMAKEDFFDSDLPF